MTAQQILPYIIPLIVVAALFFRMRRGMTPKRVSAAQLWIVPVIAVLALGSTLWFAPHPDPTPFHILALIGALALGTAMGTLRARTLTLSRHAESGDVMMQTSSYAFLLLAVLVVARMAFRRATGGQGALVIDATLLFALGMIVTQRLTLWLRVRSLP